MMKSPICSLSVLCAALVLSGGPALAGRAPADTFRAETRLTTENISAKEQALGNLLADAIRASAKSDVAFIAASAFSSSPITIAPGVFTPADVLKTLEYKNDTIAIVKLTGEQIRQALEHSLYLYPRPNSSFLHVSGLTATINPDADSDRRVLAVKVDGEALSTAKTYKVAMPAPLANGALAYFKYWKKSDIDKDTGKTLEAALNAYLADHKTIAKGEERLVAKAK